MNLNFRSLRLFLDGCGDQLGLCNHHIQNFPHVDSPKVSHHVLRNHHHIITSSESESQSYLHSAHFSVHKLTLYSHCGHCHDHNHNKHILFVRWRMEETVGKDKKGDILFSQVIIIIILQS